MRALAWVIACAACNQVFGVQNTVPYDASIGDAGDSQCAPLTYDPLRYAYVPATSIEFTVGTGRDACRKLGMDLVAFDAGDVDELTHELTGSPYPYWTGVSFVGDGWHTSDGCAPYLPWAPNEPASSAPGDCGVMDNDGLHAEHCDSMQPNVMCETPRPSAACMQAAARIGGYTAPKGPTAIAYTEATADCGSGSHLVEIDSSAELAAVQAFASANGVSPYWLGVQYASEWVSVTGCPVVFAWQPTEPSFADSCVRGGNGGMQMWGCNDIGSVFVVCEPD